MQIGWLEWAFVPGLRSFSAARWSDRPAPRGAPHVYCDQSGRVLCDDSYASCAGGARRNRAPRGATFAAACARARTRADIPRELRRHGGVVSPGKVGARKRAAVDGTAVRGRPDPASGRLFDGGVRLAICALLAGAAGARLHWRVDLVRSKQSRRASSRHAGGACRTGREFGRDDTDAHDMATFGPPARQSVRFCC